MDLVFGVINPKMAGMAYIEPSYSQLHPYKSFLIKLCMVAGVFIASSLACVFMAAGLYLIGAPAFVGTPMAFAIGIWSALMIGNIVTGEVK